MGLRRTAQIRRKTFLCYHHADEKQVTDFMERFDRGDKAFITRALGDDMPGDVIDSDNPTYVMRRIGELYLQDSTITIVMLGRCTWSRRYVDWELQASLRSGEQTIPNGVLGIRLPTATSPANPDRLDKNLPKSNSIIDHNKAYARRYRYPENKSELVKWIEDAYQARTSRKHLIDNPRDRFSYNRQCS